MNIPCSVTRQALETVQSDVDHQFQTMQYRPCAVAIIQASDGDILCVRSVAAKGAQWGFVQGGINRNESVMDALYREVYEEVRIEREDYKVMRLCQIDKLKIPNKQGQREGFTKGKRYYFFHLRCFGLPDVRYEKSELSDFCWLAPMDVSDMLKGTPEYEAKRQSLLRALGNIGARRY